MIRLDFPKSHTSNTVRSLYPWYDNMRVTSINIVDFNRVLQFSGSNFLLAQPSVWSCWGCAVVLSLSAQHCDFVGVGVLLGVGHTIVLLVEMSLVFLKLKKKKSQVGLGGDISWPCWWSPCWFPTLPLSSPLLS